MLKWLKYPDQAQHGSYFVNKILGKFVTVMKFYIIICIKKVALAISVNIPVLGTVSCFV